MSVHFYDGQFGGQKTYVPKEKEAARNDNTSLLTDLCNFTGKQLENRIQF
jgi:hypothetical protein